MAQIIKHRRGNAEELGSTTLYKGEMGAFSDRYLLEEQPLKVLFGMVVCAYIIGSDEGVLYIRGEYIQ